MPISERVVEQKILIAVDFGTTFSSVLWQQTGEAGGQHIIQDWPDEDYTSHYNNDVVPTTLRYDNHGYRWGYQIQDQEERYEWFKLGLDPSMQKEKSSLARKYPPTTSLTIQHSSNRASSPQQLTTDYLKALCCHAERMLLRTVLEAVLRRTQREYVITVPAVWEEKARDLTAKCAVDAGMGSEDKLHIVSEPEAAAIYAISKFQQINTGGLEIGDTFVLCDAGGGTVDLISYTIQSLEPIIELEEAAPGSGSACGSTFLNRIFAETLNKRFKGDSNWNPDVLDTAMDHFEKQTKNRFGGKRGDNIPVHGLGHRPDVTKNRLQLSIKDLKKIFEPVISEILALIQDQIQQTAKTVKLILLVGGFGNSIYLQNRVQETFGPDIEVKVSPDRASQTAVARGALMKGLAEVKGLTTKLPRIRARKARKHFGTECVTPYKRRQRPDDDGHSPERRTTNPYAGEDHVEIMKWFLHKGDKIVETEPAIFSFSTDALASTGPPKQFSIPVYCHTDSRNTGAPRYRDSDVEKLGTVTADIHSIDRQIIKRERGGNGKDYYILDFDIEMRCFAGRLEFTPIYLYAWDGQIRFQPAVFSLE